MIYVVEVNQRTFVKVNANSDLDAELAVYEIYRKNDAAVTFDEPTFEVVAEIEENEDGS